MANPIQRLNYHTGLFLEEAEFKLEQNYHLIMRQRINYAVFKPGVFYGMALDYTGGVLKVTAGMAIDEKVDLDFGQLGRELVLFQDSDPVALAGFGPGDTAWITIEYEFSLDAPKAPTNLAARYTQKVKIIALHANPGPGTDKILLGQIVIGTNSVTDPVQKASLRMTGAPLPVPVVTNFAPLSGGAGTPVVITGTSFTGATAVAFGGVPATVFTVNSATQITATVPAGAVTGKIRVTTPVGFGESAADFTVVPAPAIKSILPTSQAVGGTLAIRGSDIRSSALAPGAPAAGTTIRFVDPGNAANFVNAATGTVLTDVATATGPQRVQVIVPAKGALPNIVDITLEINGVSATSPQQFTFV